MPKNKLVNPFVKWVGGKRQLLPEIKKYLPKFKGKYYEPFVGGGAVLFALQPKNAVVNDINEELINVYSVVKNNVEHLIEDLKKHINEPDYFYEIRGLDRLPEFEKISKIERASRILYLNKTCYNGLYRVNNSGEFNAPFGRYKNPNIVNEITLRAVSKYLNENEINIVNQNFKDSLSNVSEKDFVYFDPPYDPVSKSSNFTGYSQGGFNMYEQIELRKQCDLLHEKGVCFLLSNSYTPFILEQYKDYKIEEVLAGRAINSVASKRGQVKEVLIRNYD